MLELASSFVLSPVGFLVTFQGFLVTFLVTYRCFLVTYHVFYQLFCYPNNVFCYPFCYLKISFPPCYIFLSWRIRSIRNSSFQQTYINKTIDKLHNILKLISNPYMF